MGFPEEENTYEPEENLNSCRKKLEDYKLRWGSDKRCNADKLKDEKLILAKNSADDPILYSSIIETVKITDRAPSDIMWVHLFFFRYSPHSYILSSITIVRKVFLNLRLYSKERPKRKKC